MNVQFPIPPFGVCASLYAAGDFYPVALSITGAEQDAHDIDIVSRVVAVRAHLEKLREQVSAMKQNRDAEFCAQCDQTFAARCELGNQEILRALRAWRPDCEGAK